MIKNLRYVMLSLIAMVCGSLYAQTVTFDFSGEDRWGIGTTNVVEAKSYTYDGYTIKLTPTAGNYFRWYTSGNILLGKQGATLELPPFDFDVERIDIEGTSGASAAVKQNFFVGDEAVSTETTGAKDVTNKYKIAEDKQAAGTVYTLKVTSNHNTQITKIMIYKKGEAGDDNDDDDNNDNPTTASSPWTVAEALQACAGLGANEYIYNGAEVYVAGIITQIDEVSTSYGNATYYISDDAQGSNRLEVYRGYSLNGDKFTSENEIEIGDTVTVCGKIVNYNGSVLEFTTGSKLVSLKKGEGNTGGGNGGGNDEPTTPTVPAEGVGSADSPYNVTAALEVGKDGEKVSGVYVKGIIVGYVSGSTISGAKFSTDDATDTNLLIAASADETNIKNCMPIQLPKGDIRTYLNLADNAGNYQKEVILYGDIEKYFSVTGLKTVTYAIINGQEIGNNPTSISNITTTAQSGQAYNMAGQKVSDNYRGLIIKDGKKIMVK